MIDNIYLYPSFECNLKCGYCKIQRTESCDLSPHTLRRFLEGLPLNSLTNVVILGGEPTLFPEKIHPLVMGIKEVERRKPVTFRFSMYTNASNADVAIDLMRKEIIGSKNSNVSWDGLKSTLSRVPKDDSLTDAYFRKNINMLGSSFGKDLTLAIAIHPETIPYLHESLIFALASGFRSFYYYILQDFPYDVSIASEFKEQLSYVISRYIKRFPYSDLRFRFTNINSYFSKDKSRICDSRTGNSIAITPSGTLYRCPCTASKALFPIGDVFNGIDAEKERLMQEVISSCSPCSKDLLCHVCPFGGCNSKCFLYEAEIEVYEHYRKDLLACLEEER